MLYSYTSITDTTKKGYGKNAFEALINALGGQLAHEISKSSLPLVYIDNKANVVINNIPNTNGKITHNNEEIVGKIERIP